MQFETALMQTFVLLVPILIGCLIRKINLVDDSFAPNLSKFLFNVSLPATIIHVMQMNYDKNVLVSGGQIMLICILIALGSFGISVLFVKIFKEEQMTQNVYQFAITFSNFSYMAYPVAQGLYGDEGLFYTVLYSLPLFVLVNSVGILLLHKSNQKPKLSDCKKVINMPTIAVVIGVVLFMTSVKFSGGIDKVISMLHSTTTPLAMVLAGLVLSNGHLRDIFMDLRLYAASFIRLILIPVLVYFVLRWIGMSGLMLYIPILVSSMPVVANIVILTSNGKGDSQTSANVLLLSTLLSIITIPIMTTLLR